MTTIYNRFIIMTDAQWLHVLPMVHQPDGAMGNLINHLKTTTTYIDATYPMPIGTVCVVRATGFMAGGVAWHSSPGTDGSVFYRCQYVENITFSDSQGEWRVWRNTMHYGNGVTLDKHQYVARLEYIND
jgi:hypothetical protein